MTLHRHISLCRRAGASSSYLVPAFWPSHPPPWTPGISWARPWLPLFEEQVEEACRNRGLPVSLHLMHQPFAAGSGPDVPLKCGVRSARVGMREEMWLLFWLWGARSVMKRLPLFHRIHFSEVHCAQDHLFPHCLLNKKGELYYCANESSRQRLNTSQILINLQELWGLWSPTGN